MANIGGYTPIVQKAAGGGGGGADGELLGGTDAKWETPEKKKKGFTDYLQQITGYMTPIVGPLKLGWDVTKGIFGPTINKLKEKSTTHYVAQEATPQQITQTVAPSTPTATTHKGSQVTPKPTATTAPSLISEVKRYEPGKEPWATKAVYSEGKTQEGIPLEEAARIKKELGYDINTVMGPRNLALEQQNLAAIMSNPDTAKLLGGVDIKTLPADDYRRQLIQEQINMATYGTAIPKFLTNDQLAKMNEAWTAKQAGATKDVTGSETATSATSATDITATAPTTEPPGVPTAEGETEKLTYESMLPEVQKYLDALKEFEAAKIGQTYAARYGDVAQKYNELEAQSQAAFGASGASQYGYSPGEKMYFSDLAAKEDRDMKELAQAEQMDLQNALLGIQSNYLEAKKADITNRLEVDKYNIEAVNKQAQERANIQKTLADTQAVLSNINNISRDDARAVIKDMLTITGSAGLENISAEDLRALEQKAGYPSGYLSKNLQTIKEIEAEAKKANAEKPRIEIDPRTGAVVAAWVDDNGNLIVKKEGQQSQVVYGGVNKSTGQPNIPPGMSVNDIAEAKKLFYQSGADPKDWDESTILYMYRDAKSQGIPLSPAIYAKGEDYYKFAYAENLGSVGSVVEDEFGKQHTLTQEELDSMYAGKLTSEQMEDIKKNLPTSEPASQPQEEKKWWEFWKEEGNGASGSW
jgi:hypothetical protein